MKSFLLFWVLALVAMSASSSAMNAEGLVKKADEIRNPSQSYKMQIQVESDGDASDFDVYLKGQDKTLIVTKSPARDKGRNMLMLDRDFYAYIPNLKRSMRLSLAQKLSGQVANGDISRTRWYGDYDVKLEKENKKFAQLFLKARKQNLTYAAIRLWIEKSTNRPIKAEYLGSNGTTVLKKASFENYKKILGVMRPTILRITDPAGKTSLIKINEMKNESFPDSFFTVRNMETFK